MMLPPRNALCSVTFWGRVRVPTSLQTLKLLSSGCRANLDSSVNITLPNHVDYSWYVADITVILPSRIVRIEEHKLGITKRTVHSCVAFGVRVQLRLILSCQMNASTIHVTRVNVVLWLRLYTAAIYRSSVKSRNPWGIAHMCSDKCLAG